LERKFQKRQLKYLRVFGTPPFWSWNADSAPQSPHGVSAEISADDLLHVSIRLMPTDDLIEFQDGCDYLLFLR